MNTKKYRSIAGTSILSFSGTLFFSGSLILKPTPHPSEATYQLNRTEEERLGLSTPPGAHLHAQAPSNTETLQMKMKTNNEGGCKHSLDRCEYIRLAAIRGKVLLFPSFIHHAVMPCSIKPEYRSSERALRISVAFNFNQISQNLSRNTNANTNSN